MQDPLPAKSIFQSKTFWLNVCGVAALVASGQAGVRVPSNVATIVLAVANIANRFLTSQPVTIAPRPPTP